MNRLDAPRSHRPHKSRQEIYINFNVYLCPFNQLVVVHNPRENTPLASAMEGLSVSALAVKRPDISSRNASRSGARRSSFKLDEAAGGLDSPERKPIVTSTKSTRCYRPKAWNTEVEQAFRVQQAGWRDLKEYMETYGEPDRWENGLIRCTRVKSNGYYTYWYEQPRMFGVYCGATDGYDPMQDTDSRVRRQVPPRRQDVRVRLSHSGGYTSSRSRTSPIDTISKLPPFPFSEHWS